MKGKRSGLDFSKHEVIVTKTDEIMVHYLKKPNTGQDSIKFINTNGIMAVTGDYGNWIFCREFHPSADGDGFVSDGYWLEKLSIASTQKGTEFSYKETCKALRETLAEAEEEGYDDDYIEYLNTCLEIAGNGEQVDYEAYAYYNYPNDHEDIVFETEIKYWLKVVFDGFEEICRRLKNEN